MALESFGHLNQMAYYDVVVKFLSIATLIYLVRSFIKYLLGLANSEMEGVVDNDKFKPGMNSIPFITPIFIYNLPN